MMLGDEYERKIYALLIEIAETSQLALPYETEPV